MGWQEGAVQPTISEDALWEWVDVCQQRGGSCLDTRTSQGSERDGGAASEGLRSKSELFISCSSLLVIP